MRRQTSSMALQSYENDGHDYQHGVFLFLFLNCKYKYVLLVSPQYTLATDAFQLGYTEDGHCKGEVDRTLPPPQRLAWEIPVEVNCPRPLKLCTFNSSCYSYINTDIQFKTVKYNFSKIMCK